MRYVEMFLNAWPVVDQDFINSGYNTLFASAFRPEEIYLHARMDTLAILEALACR